MSSIGTSLFGYDLDSPTILASGILGATPRGMIPAIEAGAGAVTTKSLGLEPRKGHPNPCVVEVKGGYLNAMGLPNPGVSAYGKELKQTDFSAPVIGSIYGHDTDELRKAAEVLQPNVDILELNLSCPHAENLGAAVGSDPQLVEEIVEAVKGEVGAPVIAKLPPAVPDIAEIGLAAERGGADGIAAINTLPGMTIDIETRTPVLGNASGGLSGEAIHPVAVKAVYDLYSALSVPVIGLGGVAEGSDLVELILAGASAVGIGTAIAKKDLSVFSELNEFLLGYLNSTNSKLTDLIGAAHKG